jgi:ATP-binding cassette subfamily E protein 1
LRVHSFIGINIFLEGFIRTENLRFRDVALTFKVVETASEEEVKRLSTHYYPPMKKQLGSFNLSVDAGSFTESEIIVLLGENGTGKFRNFIRIFNIFCFKVKQL